MTSVSGVTSVPVPWNVVSLCLCECLPAWLAGWLSVWLSVCLSVSLSLFLQPLDSEGSFGLIVLFR